MTKVQISPFLLDYRESMAELMNQVCEETAVLRAGRENIKELCPPRKDVPELWVPGLLMHPRIELLWPDIHLKDGHLDGCIQISTSEVYGIINVYVVLEDDQGHRLESDYALDAEVVDNHWGYFPSAPVPPGTTVIVRAMAMDSLGGIGILTKRITV
jgi:hypothetical protein